MPYCEFKTSVSLDRQQKQELAKALCKVIEQIPGKTEPWIMTGIEGDTEIWFNGTDEQPSAVITLKTFGESEKKYYDLVTEGVCSTVSRLLNVPGERIYVIHEPISRWGWNGRNF